MPLAHTNRKTPASIWPAGKIRAKTCHIGFFSEAAIKGNRAGVRLGNRINIDVLNAEQQLYTAQRDLIKARYDMLLSGFKLKAAAGSLTDMDVEVADRLFR